LSLVLDSSRLVGLLFMYQGEDGVAPGFGGGFVLM
jgi:hypothetical protein